MRIPCILRGVFGRPHPTPSCFGMDYANALYFGFFLADPSNTPVFWHVFRTELPFSLVTWHASSANTRFCEAKPHPDFSNRRVLRAFFKPNCRFPWYNQVVPPQTHAKQWRAQKGLLLRPPKGPPLLGCPLTGIFRAKRPSPMLLHRVESSSGSLTHSPRIWVSHQRFPYKRTHHSDLRGDSRRKRCSCGVLPLE